MPNQADPLEQLRDIHLPDTVSLWPLAPGWWLVIIVLLITVAVGSTLLLKRYRRNAYRRSAISKLERLDRYRHDGDFSNYLQQVNLLLRQTALSFSEREAIASLTGKDWLAFLDHSGNTSEFSQGAGKILAQGPYQKSIDGNDLSQLHQLVSRWIEEHQPPC